MSWILQKRKLKDFDKVAFERNLEVKLQQLHIHHFTEDYTGALWRIYSWPRRSCCEAWLLISLILQCIAYGAPLLGHTILGIYVTSCAIISAAPNQQLVRAHANWLAQFFACLVSVLFAVCWMDDHRSRSDILASRATRAGFVVLMRGLGAFLTTALAMLKTC